MVLSSWPRHCKVHPDHMMNCWLSTRWPLLHLAIDCCHPHSPSLFIIITQP